jgi:trans-aconitate methyltransferase
VYVEKRVPGRVFGEVAELYERVRPPYPDGLFDDVLSYGQVSGRALDVGAGTGRATIAFAARGVPVVAVEPDNAMADILARRAAELAGVEIVRSSFEEFRTSERFGLLFCAEAWHWTERETRWSLAADALADGATLALFWNNERIEEPDLRTSMLRLFEEHAPAVVIRDEQVTSEDVWQQWPGVDLADCAAFTDLESRHYRSHQSMPSADYVGLTCTRSQFRTLPSETRQTMFDALTQLFDEQVPLVIDTTLLLARRVPTADNRR